LREFIKVFEKELDNVKVRLKIVNRGGEEMKGFSGNCPVCGRTMEVVEYRCPECMVDVRGKFTAGGLGGLNQKQIEFVKTFLRCRGNIKEVERELGISYPTVRNRLDAVIRALGMTPAADIEAAGQRAEVLDKLEKGEIDAETAAKLLSGKRGK
jgi:hypothetical protein